MYDNISRHVVLKFADPRFQLPRSKYHPGMIVLVLLKIILAARNIGGGGGGEGGRSLPLPTFLAANILLKLTDRKFKFEGVAPVPILGAYKK